MGKKLNINLQFNCKVIIDIDNLTAVQLGSISLHTLHMNSNIQESYNVFSDFFDEIGRDNCIDYGVSETSSSGGIYLK